MSFTFSETLADDISFIRFKLDDYLEPDEPLLSDELITSLVSAYGVPAAILLGCRRIAIFYGKEADKIGLSGNRVFSFKEQYRAYIDLYAALENEYGSLEELLGTGPPQMYGGVEVIDFPARVYREFLPFIGPEPYPLAPWHRPLDR